MFSIISTKKINEWRSLKYKFFTPQRKLISERRRTFVRHMIFDDNENEYHAGQISYFYDGKLHFLLKNIFFKKTSSSVFIF